MLGNSILEQAAQSRDVPGGIVACSEKGLAAAIAFVAGEIHAFHRGFGSLQAAIKFFHDPLGPAAGFVGDNVDDMRVWRRHFWLVAGLRRSRTAKGAVSASQSGLG